MSPGTLVALATVASPAQATAWVRENMRALSNANQSRLIRDGLDLSLNLAIFGQALVQK